MAEDDKQQNIQNNAPNQGAQGTFHGPVNFDQRQASGDVTVHGSVIGTGIAIGHNNVVQVTTVYEWARKQPADPQTVAAGRLLLDQLPTNVLPELAALPPGSQMPFSRTPTFVGREADLLSIVSTIKGGQTTAIGQAASVHGLGGVGKTTVATEFVHRYGGYFAGGVFWLSFADPVNLPVEIAQCGGERGLQLRPDFHDLPLEDQVAAVQRAWAEEIPRLLVFDNVDTDDAEKLVQQYRPTTGGCRVLITSRRGVWDKALGIVALPLGVLQRDESVALLRQFRTDLSDADADAIAEELGDLPLALHLAGSYLSSYADNPRLGDPQRYLSRLREKQLEHASMRGKFAEVSPTQHEMNVRATFALSYERLDTTTSIDETAHALLVRSAYFAPGEPIPRTLLLITLPPVSDDEDEDELEEQKEDALRRLRALGLLEREEGGALALHSLLAAFVQQTAQDDVAQAVVEEVIGSTSYEIAQGGIPAPLMPLLPHLRYITDTALDREDVQALALARHLGYCLYRLFEDYTAARPYTERALAISERVRGLHHSETATSLNNLGSILHVQGDYKSARPLYERALSIREHVFGSDHPEVANTLANLGSLLHTQGDFDSAKTLHERALSIREHVFGSDHPEVAASCNALALIRSNQGHHDEARLLYERALVIHQAIWGSEHPDVADSLCSLAGLHEACGEYDAAYSLYQQALTISETVFGSEHPNTAGKLLSIAKLLKNGFGDYERARVLYEQVLIVQENVFGQNHSNTATVVNNLAGLLQAQGKYEEALPLYERALNIWETAFGSQHPMVATGLNNLAGMFEENFHDMVKARSLYERALTIRETMLGMEHPDTATTLNGLSICLWQEAQYVQAITHMRRSLAIYQSVWGEQHPRVAESMNNLASMLEYVSEYEEAASLRGQAIVIMEATLGAEHPALATGLQGLANSLQTQGKYEEARTLYERALHIREAVLGLEHPDTAAGVNGLGELLYAWGKYTEARPLFERALSIWENSCGVEHPIVAGYLSNLGMVLSEQGEYAKSIELLRRALAIREQRLGLLHPDTALILNNLGYVLKAQGDLTDAWAMHERALAIREQVLGPNHPDTAMSLSNLGTLLKAQGKLAEVRPIYERVLTIYKHTRGSKHPHTAVALNNLALLLQDIDNLAEAQTYFEEALGIYEQVLGLQHPNTAVVLNSTARLLLEMNRSSESQIHSTRAITLQPENDYYWYWNALILMAVGDTDGSSKSLKHSYELSSKSAQETFVTYFWYGVLANLSQRSEQTQDLCTHIEQSLLEADSVPFKGLFAAYTGNVSTARSYYSEVLEDLHQLATLMNQRIYLRLLTRLFPQHTTLHEMSTWVAAELRHRVTAK
jgi:tetratricopeptide (TPR) repeat protein